MESSRSMDGLYRKSCPDASRIQSCPRESSARSTIPTAFPSRALGSPGAGALGLEDVGNVKPSSSERVRGSRSATLPSRRPTQIRPVADRARAEVGRVSMQ